MKQCSSCKETLPLDAFYSTKRGIRSECKECSRKRSRDYREANLEKCKASNRKYHAERVPTEEQLTKQRVSNKRWRDNNRDKQHESCRKWRKNNPGKHNQFNKDWRASNPDKVRVSFLKNKFGITQLDFDSMLKEQGGKCAVCGADQPGGGRKHLCVDHCHDTGKVRGLLCIKCNTGLGAFDDDVVLLSSALTYLERHSTK